jgi:hypothetical protein
MSVLVDQLEATVNPPMAVEAQNLNQETDRYIKAALHAARLFIHLIET